MKSPADNYSAHDGRGESALPSLLLPGAWVVNDWNPPADPDWQRILSDVAGLNLYGDPMLRIVNGSSRLELIGGIWGNVEVEDAGLPSLRYQWDQRYPWLEDFWLIEEWVPTLVSRDTWEAQERKWEDGLSYLVHPTFPLRGEYRFFTHFRRVEVDADGEKFDVPINPFPGGLRLLASAWARRRALAPPPTLEVDAGARERRIRQNLVVGKARRLAKEAQAKRAKKDIWDNEIGGLTGFTPRIALTGLDVPKA